MVKLKKPRALNSREIQAIYRYLDANGVEYVRGCPHADLAKRVYAFTQPPASRVDENGGVPFKRHILRAFYESLPMEFRVPPPVKVFKIRKAASAKPASSWAVRRAERSKFYESPEWRAVRYEALKESKGVCELCGAFPSPGHPLHVDHIKPRSIYPALELRLSNLQVLCDACNLGKSNRDEIDWRDKSSVR